MSEVKYFDGEEQRALGDFVRKVEEALKARDEGRNRSCFPLVSFGGKDADLDPEGCTGVRAVLGCDEDSVTVRVGGHKTVCPPEDESKTEEVQELVCGCGWPGEWTGEDWTVHFSADVTVPYQWTDERTDEENFAAIADLVIEAARNTCEQFEHDMAFLDEAVDEAMKARMKPEVLAQIESLLEQPEVLADWLEERTDADAFTLRVLRDEALLTVVQTLERVMPDGTLNEGPPLRLDAMTWSQAVALILATEPDPDACWVAPPAFEDATFAGASIDYQERVLTYVVKDTPDNDRIPQLLGWLLCLRLGVTRARGNPCELEVK